MYLFFYPFFLPVLRPPGCLPSLPVAAGHCLPPATCAAWTLRGGGRLHPRLGDPRSHAPRRPCWAQKL